MRGGRFVLGGRPPEGLSLRVETESAFFRMPTPSAIPRLYLNVTVLSRRYH